MSGKEIVIDRDVYDPHILVEVVAKSYKIRVSFEDLDGEISFSKFTISPLIYNKPCYTSSGSLYLDIQIENSGTDWISERAFRFSALEIGKYSLTISSL